MIAIVSDHGEAFGEKHLLMHANSPYHNLLHVALIVKHPGNARKGVSGEVVSLIDVAPTMLAAAGYPAPATMQGRNLGAPLTPGPVFSETFPCPALHTPACPGGCAARVIVSWPYKFLAYTGGARELYDLAADPGENRNLLSTSPALAEQLRGQLSAWVKSMPAQSRQQLKLDGEALQRLKSLGYIQ
jgi:arylsulfatase A-like enzyme